MSDVREISLSLIDDPAAPMRSAAEDEAISDLARSIRARGLINPITVRPRGDRFEVVAGHRRRLACKQAEIWNIPCIVRDLDDDAAAEVMAAENLERQDVCPLDEALFLGRLVGEDASKVPEVARRVGRSENWVWERLEILEFPDDMLPYFRDKKNSLGVLRALSRIESEFWRGEYMKMYQQGGMSVPQAEYLLAQWKLGLNPEPGSVLPATSELHPSDPPKAKALCARCGQLAVDPNLQLVYIHQECPEDTTSASPTRPPSRENP